MINTHFSQKILVFHGLTAPETGLLAGYSAVINYYELKVPLPSKLCIISARNRKYTKEGWMVFGPTYQPDETLLAHLTFALKYEGVNLNKTEYLTTFRRFWLTTLYYYQSIK